MKCFCMDRQVTELGKNYKHVKYVYRFLAEGEKKPDTVKIKRTSEDHWTEIGKFKTSYVLLIFIIICFEKSTNISLLTVCQKRTIA